MTAFCQLQTWTGGQEEHGNQLFESAEQSLLEFSPYHLCGRAKFAGMIFHLINDVETNFKEEVAGCGPEQVAWLSLSLSVWTSRNSALIGNWKYDTMLPAGPGYTRFFGQFTKSTYRGIFTQVFQNLKKTFHLNGGQTQFSSSVCLGHGGVTRVWNWNFLGSKTHSKNGCRSLEHAECSFKIHQMLAAGTDPR